MAADVWSRFTLDPRHAPNAPIRASDADRDVVRDVLGTAYAEGRITPEELDERTDQVSSTKTLGELPTLIGDIVPAHGSRTPVVRDLHAEAERRYRDQVRHAFIGFITPTLICWAIYLATGPGFSWPLFVMIGTSIHLIQLLISRRDTIASIERNLERKEQKRIQAQQRRELRSRGERKAK